MEKTVGRRLSKSLCVWADRCLVGKHTPLLPVTGSISPLMVEVLLKADI
jgi:hypothetical protein